MSDSIGLGDTIAKVTTAVGVKPCGGCQKRKHILNQMFPYSQPSVWKDWPTIPEGWQRLAQKSDHELYKNERDGWLIWDVRNGRYENAFATFSEAAARDYWLGL